MAENKRAPMTKEEIEASTQRKLSAITELMRNLHISVEARDQITRDGFIKKIVYFTDHEDYEIKEDIKSTDQESSEGPQQDKATA